jgi:hypothetical protein
MTQLDPRTRSLLEAMQASGQPLSSTSTSTVDHVAGTLRRRLALGRALGNRRHLAATDRKEAPDDAAGPVFDHPYAYATRRGIHPARAA